ncbi:MAG TPA: ABC transporter permease, partial [Thermoanaerobaculia bacterium]|nr:ABC transporter permease [Thermoanaerobaculia bacterium]
MNTLPSDLRQAARSLFRRPGFLAVAVLTLALGIGANSALFSVVHAVLMRPLPYQDAERLVWITHEVPVFGTETVVGADFLDWREGSRTLSGIAGYDDSASVTLTGRERAERLHGARVSPNFLALLGARPAQGRDFLPEEERLNAGNTAILSHRLWERLFGARTTIDETPLLTLDGNGFTVVGVLPPDFRFPGNPEIDVLVPLALDSAVERGRTRMSLLSAVGRLAPGASLEQARAELDAIHRRGEESFRPSPSSAPPPGGPSNVSPRGSTRQFSMAPGSLGLPEMILKVVPLREHLVGDARPSLLMLLGAVGFVLLIACANVANLLLARATARQREIAVRAALGAGRFRIARHLLLESALLGLMGGACGLALAALGVRLLVTAVPAELAGGAFRQIPIGIDGTVLLFTLGLSLATGLLFGLAPAMAASRPDLQAPLKQGGRAGGGSNAARRLLVAAEVALAAVLLIGAGLLFRSFLRVGTVDPGFRPEGVLTAALELDTGRYAAPASQAGFAQTLAERVRGLPGVEAAGFGDTVPLAGFNMLVGGPRAEGLPEQEDPLQVAMVVATPGYFEAIGIPMRRGRAFTEED